MNAQPTTHQTYPKCHSVTVHILWMVNVVGGGVAGGFMGGLVGGGVGGC